MPFVSSLYENKMESLGAKIHNVNTGSRSEIDPDRENWPPTSDNWVKRKNFKKLKLDLKEEGLYEDKK